MRKLGETRLKNEKISCAKPRLLCNEKCFRFDWRDRMLLLRKSNPAGDSSNQETWMIGKVTTHGIF
jgi:hypothetical protein